MSDCFSTNDDRFFSLTANGDEITLVIPASALTAFTAAELSVCSVNQAEWCAIHLTAGARGVGSAMVDQVASVLGKHAISIYYVSASNDDFLLVRNTVFTPLTLFFAIFRQQQ